jgi:Fic family protein
VGALDLSLFTARALGQLVPIFGTDMQQGAWEHRAFVPDYLPDSSPQLANETHLAIANARASLAALDSTARQLPNPTLLRNPTLRREAQSTSALEGTYAPLEQVLTADYTEPGTANLNEIMNYVKMADAGFVGAAAGWPLTPSFLAELQGILMRGMPLEPTAGRFRENQVVIGRRAEADPGDLQIVAARFVPPPPGLILNHRISQLLDWMRADHSGKIDPIVAAGMAHYQFETLHPFCDGNGRIGRYLIVLHLLSMGVLSEPTLTVSPWFEARRQEYYDYLFAVSANGEWNGFLKFFAQGLGQAATETRNQMISLVAVQSILKEQVRASRLRADSAQSLVDFAVANPSFTAADAQQGLGLSYARINALIAQLNSLGILKAVNPDSYRKRYYAPAVLRLLTAKPNNLPS